MLGSWSQGGFLPYTTMIDRNWGDGKVTRLFVRAVGWEDVPPLIRLIPEVVREHQAAPYLVIRTQEEQLERIKTTFMWVEALLWLGIAASLMLGGFGIWYGTFAAVRARTREVGLKKAMGGSDTDILAQFLAEALCKSVPAAFWALWWASPWSKSVRGRWARAFPTPCWSPAVWAASYSPRSSAWPAACIRPFRPAAWTWLPHCVLNKR